MSGEVGQDLAASSAAERTATAKRSAIRFILLLGVVSLFADATYEGARSIAGPYLSLLGASATVVGFVAGFGEFAGYGLRLLSGYLSDRLHRYWTITFIGYAINLLAVPALALAHNWQAAAALLILERAGRAIRTPARDAMLSHAASETGRGWGFGVHEAMDQIGATFGPLVVALVLYLKNDYRLSFLILLAPALLSLATLTVARALYPRPQDLEPVTARLETQGLDRRFWIYLLAFALVAIGYADFSLIAYHFERTAVVSNGSIPLLYAVAMGIDALAALVLGRLFDRIGFTVLAASVLLAAMFAPLAFYGGFVWAALGVGLWGFGMGAQESLMRAAIADMVPPTRRGSAYGIFDAGYGFAWFLGSLLLGYLYDRSIFLLVTVSIIVQLLAVPLIIAALNEGEAR
ncbi:MFS transporter [Pyrinomonas methylaliphatogenes]|uniref:Major Facilitator Superfamily transporter n=1 Tax=Pyrinomonas methylaliphatogenes TaxID=454194 RepID=A0A0B6WU74_9BACT|nr:MFS transporter [Pyrinomonas methylaliphatogenes]MBX5477488.1 MFS transporter [Pyrinomonas methylaliphatogenes]CDM64237.1 Major Facilitator Superfamily transporter [Pyrinomonas methylaliphatogenes]